jgi:hypothetical protein
MRIIIHVCAIIARADYLFPIFVCTNVPKMAN